MELVLKGLHHVTAITSDAAAAAMFYTRVLGLRLVKKTVNFDDPTAYHLYFGNDEGRPGTLLTFFDWGPSVEPGQLGPGVAHHIAFSTIEGDSLSSWKEWPARNGASVQGPFSRGSYDSLYLRDHWRIATGNCNQGERWGIRWLIEPGGFLTKWDDHSKSLKSESKEMEGSPELRLKALHHVTALSKECLLNQEFYTTLLGLAVKSNEVDTVRVDGQKLYGLGQGIPGSMISFIDVPGTNHRQVGVGTVHHIAFAVEDEEVQLEWREKLLASGVEVTRVLDWKYFRSIYFREPNGLLLEIATIPPGFMIDEQESA